MNPTWYPPAGRPLGSGIRILGPLGLICTGSLLLPSGKARIFLSLPPLLYILSQVRTFTAGTVPEDYLLAVNAVALVVKWIDFVVFHNPEDDLYRIAITGKEKGTKRAEDPRNMRPWAKYGWSLAFWSTVRGWHLDLLPGRLG